MTSETSEFWALPSGSVEVEAHLGPVRFRNDRNEWVDVDLGLQRLADGSVVSKAHPVGLRLAGAEAADGEHDLVTLGRGDGQGSLVWSGRLPEPVLEGTKATWPQVRPGVDLVVEATRTGYESFLVVKDRAAVSQVRQVRMALRSKTLRYVSDGRGGLEIRDKAGRAVGVSPAPIVAHAAAVHAARGRRISGEGSPLARDRWPPNVPGRDKPACSTGPAFNGVEAWQELSCFPVTLSGC